MQTWITVIFTISLALSNAMPVSASSGQVGVSIPPERPLAYTCGAGFVETGNYEWNHTSVNLSGANSLGDMWGSGDYYTTWKGTITFSFSGDSLKILYHYFWRTGGFTVSIDGVGRGTITTTANGQDETVVRTWQGPTLTRGTHTVVLTYIYPFHTTWSGYKTLNCNDTTPPTVAVSLVPSGWTNQNVVATANASDPGSGVAHTYCKLATDGSWTDSGTSSCSRTASLATTFYYYATDNLGNISSVGNQAVTIDKASPSPSASKSPSSTWSNQNILATASATDTGGSGIAHIYCKLASEGSWTDSGTASCQRTATQTSVFQYYAVDGAGNSGGSAGSPFTLSLNIDTILPAATSSKNPPDEWSAPSVDVSAAATDTGGSGVAHIYCKLQGEGSFQDTGPAPCSRTGITSPTYFYYYAVDAAGNSHGTSASPLVTPVRQDNIPPSVQVFVPSAPGLIYTASWMAVDGQTTLRDYSLRYKDETGAWQVPLTNAKVLELELFGNPGINTNQVCVQATDSNGNTSDWTCSATFSVGEQETSYYSFGGRVVAMRTGAGTTKYLSGDQISSTSLVTDTQGNVVAQTRYEPYGQVRWNGNGSLQTDKTYTSQRNDGMGLMDYQARAYDAQLGRFISPDTIIPEVLQGTLAWDHYGYVSGNPILHNDPSGHCFGPLLLACIIAPNFIVDNAAVISAITLTAAITLPWVSADSPTDNPINSPTTPDDLIEQGFASLAITDIGNELLEFGNLLGATNIYDDTDYLSNTSTNYNNILDETDYQSGTFSMLDWSGYPDGPVPKPSGPFRLLSGNEYDVARKAADRINTSMHASDASLDGLRIHEIQPVKFGGNPTDPTNKIALPPSLHAQYTKWWTQQQRKLEGK